MQLGRRPLLTASSPPFPPQARVEVRLQPRAACAEHGGETQVAAAALQVVLPRVQVEVPERVADAGHVGVHLHGDPRLGAVEDARL